MISKFSIGNLGLISTFCGISALAMMVNYKKSEKEKYARQPFCREPVKLLRNHQGANHVLGTPITLGVRKSTNYFNSIKMITRTLMSYKRREIYSKDTLLFFVLKY